MHIDRVEVRESEDSLTLVLGTAAVEVMLIRVRYDGWVDEVVNGAGTVAPGPGAWTLIGHELSFDFGVRSASALGLPRDCRLRLDVDDEGIRRVRAALLEILQCACFVLDTPEGRMSS